MITLITIRDDDARIINLIQRRKLKIYILHRTHALRSSGENTYGLTRVDIHLYIGRNVF